MTWTDERVNRLKKLRALGFSASLVAQQLGVSRSAVLGKMFRLREPSSPTKYVKPHRIAPPRSAPCQDAVLQLMSDGRERTTTEVGERIGLKTSDAWKVLARLTQLGFIARTQRARDGLPDFWVWIEEDE